MNDEYLHGRLIKAIIQILGITRDMYVQPNLFQQRYLGNLCGELNRVSSTDDKYSRRWIITAIIQILRTKRDMYVQLSLFRSRKNKFDSVI